MKFLLFVEGPTEKKAIPSFLKRWLDPKISERVAIQPVSFEGWGEFRKKIAKRVRMSMEGPDASEIVGAIGLLDLYGPTFFPDGLSLAGERHSWAVADIENEIGHAKFRMFFAVHEVEAWILSQPELFPAAIAKALAKFIRPESVDFDEHPAKLLDRLYRSQTGREYRKVVYGNSLFGRLDPAVAYQKCPYLAAMLEEMLRMARQVGL